MLLTGDCLELLDRVADNSVDALITDPPFGINYRYNTHKDDPTDYIKWLWPRIEAAERKLKPGSPVFIWQSMTHMRKLAEWFPREWRLFIAAKNFVQIRQTAMQYAVDPILVWWTPGAKPYALGTASRDYYLSNTTPSSFKGLNRAKWHSCPRPLDVVSHILNQWVRPDGTVLDIFSGSATTGVACALSGRNYIGIEIDPEYNKLAEDRLDMAFANYKEMNSGVCNVGQ